MARDKEDGFDYLTFYNHFRSPPSELKKHQSIFLDYYRGCRKVLDVGCGRGEFLELLRDNGIGCVGIDIDPKMVSICQSRGLPAEQADAVALLERASDNDIDSLFCDQVIEHLEPGYRHRLLRLSHDGLAPGGRLVVKTINPLSLATFTDFYLDATHTRPIHPETLKYLLHSLGFEKIILIFFSRVPDPERLSKFELSPGLGDRERRMAEIYNHNVDVLNRLLFGAEDYAVIARKKA
jgi:O-antigen chain-terminating methyltransferase